MANPHPVCRYEKGHKNPGPGRPRNPPKQIVIFNELMAKAELEPLSIEELQKAQDAALKVAQSGDFNFFKLIMERYDDQITTEFTEVHNLEDVIKAKNQVMTSVSKRKIGISKARKMIDLISAAKDLDIHENIKAAENLKKARGII